jgi:hypothetical protein
MKFSKRENRWFRMDGTDDHIGGFFEHYRDYLAQSKTPQELDMRKIYVIQWINYQRKMEQVGTVKNFLAGMVSLFRDPINFGIAALTGGAGNVVGGGSVQGLDGEHPSSLRMHWKVPPSTWQTPP